MQYLRNTPVKVLVRAFEPEDIDRIKAEGGHPIRTAEASANNFIDWLDMNLSKA